MKSVLAFESRGSWAHSWALLSAATQTGISLSSYCSVARGEVFKHGIFSEIGDNYGKTAAQVVLRWILQKGVPINTMSTKYANMQANFEVMDFTLSSVDMDRVDAMARTGYRVVDKSRVPWAPSGTEFVAPSAILLRSYTCNKI